MADIDFFDIVYTCRSMRRLKPDPVPDELIYKVLDAGIQGPSGGGTQAWRFVVVTEPELKRQIAAVYQRGWQPVLKSYAAAGLNIAEDKNVRAATYLADHLAEAPVLLFACLRMRRSHAERLAGPNALNFARIMGGSIYPAVQNMLLACRALGLGATLTGVTSQAPYEDEVKSLLGLPASISTYGMLVIGYPKGKFGPVTRIPVEKVAWHNRYDMPFEKPKETT